MDRENSPLPEQPNETYDSIVKKMTELSNREVSVDKALQLFRESNQLVESFKKLQNYSEETLNNVYPNRFQDLFLPVLRFKKTLIDSIDFRSITPDEVTDCIGVMIEKYVSSSENSSAGLDCFLEDDHFYHIRHSSLGPNTGSPVDSEIKRVIQENNKQMSSDSNEFPQVTESLLSEMIEQEKKRIKIHLCLSADKRRVFLEHYLKEIKSVRGEMSEYRASKAMPNANPTRDDYINEGFGLTQLPEMKFVDFNRDEIRQDLEGNRSPDFVFYVPTNLSLEQTMKIKEAALKSIAKVLDQIDGESVDDLPRYSTPYVSLEGKAYKSLSVAQGDSDFKNYLKRIGKLDQYSDSTKNHAVSL